MEAVRGTREDLDSAIEHASMHFIEEYQRTGADMGECCLNAWEASLLFVSIRHDGLLMGVFGLMADGGAWAISTRHAEKHSVKCAKLSRKILEEALGFFDSLYTLADPKHKVTMKWLKWLGFVEHSKAWLQSSGYEMILMEKRR